MGRTLALLIVGALAGCGLVVLFSGGSGAGLEREPLAEFPPAPDLAAVAAVAAGDARLATFRLVFYERAAAVPGSAALEPLIEAAAARPASIERELELEALLARAAELDRAHAARIGETFFLETRFLLPVYREWAIADAGRALQALAAIRAPERQQAFALAVLDGLGNNAANAGRVAAALPEQARFGFEHEAFLTRVRLGPEDAIAEIGRAGRHIRQFEESAAKAWARVDPHAALDYAAASIEDDLSRQPFVAWVYEAWSAVAPEEAVAHLAAPQNAAVLANRQALGAVARNAPRRLLELADSIQGRAAYELRLEAIKVIAVRDVHEALRYIDTLSSAGTRTGLLIAVAGHYAKQNPNGALAWVESLSPPLPQAREEVIQGIAASDPDRALDLVLAEIARDTRGGMTSLPTFMMRMVTSRGSGAARLMNRLLDTANTRSLVDQSLSLWTRTDPDDALAWAFANLDRLDEATFARMAADFARASPADAEGVLASLPPERRGTWLAAVAGAIGQTNSDEAMAFVERYRGQPGYAEGLSAVLRGVARTNPQRAARMFADVGQLPAGETLLLIAGSWVQRNPEEAGAWAVGFADDEQRIRAVRAVVMSWTQIGPGAREWVLGLSRGAERDAALDVLLFGGQSAGAASGALSSALLEAYSSDEARQRGVGRAAVLLGRRNAETARLLIDAHVTDPVIREQIEELLAQPDAQRRISIELFGVD